MKDSALPVHRSIRVSLVLSVLTLVVYLPSLNHDFVIYDDPLYVTDNARVQQGLTLDNVEYAFTTFDAYNWHPLTWLSHILDWELFGSNPAGHHGTNIFLHALNAGLLCFILSRMTAALWPALLTGLLFALHPLHVESVAWVAERKDVLSTLFGLVAVGAYGRYAAKPGVVRFAMVWIAMALSLLAKPMFVTLPFLLLLLDWWPLGRFQAGGNRRRRLGWLIVEKIPLFVLSGASSVLTILAQSAGAAIQTFDQYPLSIRLANAALSYVGYLRKMVWPAELVIHYSHPKDQISFAWAIACVVLLVSVSVAAVLLARRNPYFPVGWFWYLGTAVPIIGIVQVGGQAMADRYTYLPLIGVFLLLSWSASDLIERLPRPQVWRWTAAAGLALVLALGSLNQLRHWKSSETLLTHALASQPNSAHVHVNLSAYYMNEGNYGKAKHHAEMALAADPGRPAALTNLGIIAVEQGQNDEAASHFRRALERDPSQQLALFHLGVRHYRRGDSQNAIRLLERYVALVPTDANARTLLGLAELQTGQPRSAEDHFRLVLSQRPDDQIAWNGLGVALAAQGRAEEARRHFEELLARFPDNEDAAKNLKRVRSMASGE